MFTRSISSSKRSMLVPASSAGCNPSRIPVLPLNWTSTAMPVSLVKASIASFKACPCGSVASHIDQYTNPSPLCAEASAFSASLPASALLSLFSSFALSFVWLPPHAVSASAKDAITAMGYNNFLFIFSSVFRKIPLLTVGDFLSLSCFFLFFMNYIEETKTSVIFF